MKKKLKKDMQDYLWIYPWTVVGRYYLRNQVDVYYLWTQVDAYYLWTQVGGYYLRTSINR